MRVLHWLVDLLDDRHVVTDEGVRLYDRIRSTGELEFANFTTFCIYLLMGHRSSIMRFTSRSDVNSSQQRMLDIFEEKYKDYEVILNPGHQYYICLDGTAIVLRSLRLCTEFLRVFGSQIRKMQIDYTEFDPRGYDALQKLIARCSQLNRIQFFVSQNFPINNGLTLRPCENVQYVHLKFPLMIWQPMQIQLASIATFFPYVETVILENLTDSHIIVPALLPAMNHLCVTYDEQPNNFDNLNQLLNTNYKIKSFVFKSRHWNLDPTLRETIYTRLTSLAELVLAEIALNIEEAVGFFAYRRELTRFQFCAPRVEIPMDEVARIRDDIINDSDFYDDDGEIGDIEQHLRSEVWKARWNNDKLTVAAEIERSNIQYGTISYDMVFSNHAKCWPRGFGSRHVDDLFIVQLTKTLY